MATFHLKIIAYDKIFYDDEAVSIVLPAVDGEIQIMANHEEYVIALKEGEVRIMTSDRKMIPQSAEADLWRSIPIIRWKCWWIRLNARKKLMCAVHWEAKERVEERMRQLRVRWSIIEMRLRWHVRWHV